MSRRFLIRMFAAIDGAEKLSLFDAIFNTQAHTRQAQRIMYIKETVVGC